MRYQKTSIFLTIIAAMLVLTFQHAAADSSLKALEQKVEVLWQARVDRDNAAIYALTDLEFQKTMKKKDFLRSAGLSPNSYVIKEVVVTESGKKGRSKATFEATKMGQTFSAIWMTENWLYQDGQWRVEYSNQPNPFKPKKK